MLSRTFLTIATSSGGFSLDLDSNQKHIESIVVIANSASTSFDFKLVNQDGITMYSREDIVGELNESVRIPCFDKFTARVTNASVDENFTLLIVYENV